MTDHRPIGSCCRQPFFTSADEPAGPDVIDVLVDWLENKIRQLASRINDNLA